MSSQKQTDNLIMLPLQNTFIHSFIQQTIVEDLLYIRYCSLLWESNRKQNRQ